MTKKITTRQFDMANYLHSEEDIAAYLKFAFELRSFGCYLSVVTARQRQLSE